MSEIVCFWTRNSMQRATRLPQNGRQGKPIFLIIMKNQWGKKNALLNYCNWTTNVMIYINIQCIRCDNQIEYCRSHNYKIKIDQKTIHETQSQNVVCTLHIHIVVIFGRGKFNQNSMTFYVTHRRITLMWFRIPHSMKPAVCCIFILRYNKNQFCYR